MESVSVIIPNYNGKKYLDDCIGSLKKQTYRDFCVIIVDNGSTDGSCEYIRNNYPEVKLIALQKNIGFAGAVNVGIKAAEGKYDRRKEYGISDRNLRRPRSGFFTVSDDG